MPRSAGIQRGMREGRLGQQCDRNAGLEARGQQAQQTSSNQGASMSSGRCIWLWQSWQVPLLRRLSPLLKQMQICAALEMWSPPSPPHQAATSTHLILIRALRGQIILQLQPAAAQIDAQHLCALPAGQPYTVGGARAVPAGTGGAQEEAAAAVAAQQARLRQTAAARLVLMEVTRR